MSPKDVPCTSENNNCMKPVKPVGKNILIAFIASTRLGESQI